MSDTKIIIYSANIQSRKENKNKKLKTKTK